MVWLDGWRLVCTEAQRWKGVVWELIGVLLYRLDRACPDGLGMGLLGDGGK